MAKKQKAKTRKVVVKRFKLTKGGKMLKSQSKTTHLGRKDDSSTKSRKKRLVEVKGKFKKKFLKMLKV